MFIPRQLDLMKATAHKSCFLFGPRQTGKSMLIRETLPAGTPIYELLDYRRWMDLSADPTRMRQEIEAKNLRDKLVVVDEIQKLPVLLDEIQLLIETRKLRFLLTGSSARKLRRSGVNLLGGRARSLYLHPFSWKELGARFDLLTALNRGLLPSVYFSDDAGEDLRSYVGTYLKEEIAAEGLTRNIPAFARFLEVAAACSGQMFNKTAVASDAQVPRATVIEYFEILKDTLTGYELPAWNRSKKRKAIETAKFYLFDVGVTRALRKSPSLAERSADFGDALEHFLFHELRTYIDTRAPGCDLRYWRSTSQFEVDFILGGHTAIEVKATRNVSPRDLRGLEALAEEKMMKHLVLVCREGTPRKLGAILILPWQEFLERLWSDAFVG
jgi:predicted AAA+ superfamily ATPase